MNDHETILTDRLKRLGYARNKQIRMYGEQFDLVSDPIAIAEQLVVIDGIESKSGHLRRVRIPLPILKMIRQDIRAREPRWSGLQAS